MGACLRRFTDQALNLYVPPSSTPYSPHRSDIIELYIMSRFEHTKLNTNAQSPPEDRLYCHDCRKKFKIKSGRDKCILCSKSLQGKQHEERKRIEAERNTWREGGW
ncbi:hypothetical protein P280DRAFT_508820 [Massarina eburnea CBS 473.64]|uniref:Uncharacterized protein n=1 Tax=Massarina eburnea CBS 473.64 TaxID=1395130 RepID=A0A6A6RX56_9PLEO|nr:hypothetical protein P280DRAFT_508820 [Massarina eburnea CBS 473.64]